MVLSSGDKSLFHSESQELQQSLQFGIYVHIPYCIQRCSYCDFATYVQSEIRPSSDYVSLLKKEITYRKNLFSPRRLDTLYFGGGTPSLIPAEQIVDIIRFINESGFTTGPSTEVTIEINPATVNEKKLEMYLKAGVNRFSVGAQTFSDRLLKMVKREHNAQQTIDTLELLRRYQLNFSFDILFALPSQSLDELRYDVETAVQLGSSHISPYCLTVPTGHPLSKNRPLDEVQIEMFDAIDQGLTNTGFYRYEISNYAKPGFESKHNLLYWTDQNYWGVGLSAHSYSRPSAADAASGNRWGKRFWNPNNLDVYAQEIESDSVSTIQHFEALHKHEALTDYCHTSLRIMSGLQWKSLEAKFDLKIKQVVQKLAAPLVEKGLLLQDQDSLRLSSSGLLISNQIFETFTFLENDIETH